ncbi:MAG: Fe-S protein [Gammaproteobacteria bacterium]|jgi:reductive dehalogenase|nr:Fe-S protein [Gammaproteobacteria bacterium]
MLIHEKSHNRPVELGSYPLEALTQDLSIIEQESQRPAIAGSLYLGSEKKLAQASNAYLGYLAPFSQGDIVPHKAPVPDSLERRSVDIKGAIYFLDASHAGICKIPQNSCLTNTERCEHTFAIIILVAYGRLPEQENLAYEWLSGVEHDIARLRCVEIGASISGYIRNLGFEARSHFEGNTLLDLNRLAVLSGVAERTENQLDVQSPFLGKSFALAVISTNYELAVDIPYKTGSRVGQFSHWRGISGAMSSREISRRKKRQSHLSRYPMEQVKRIDRPTTLILDDEVPRVPKRAAFFARAAHGDLGAKAQKEVTRFAYKHPMTGGMMPLLRTLAGKQEGEVTQLQSTDLTDPNANAKALKSLAYHLGADLTGICEIPRYAWYSHHMDGREIETYHRYAVVMLIDQGHGTMEGASGDDWVSGGQSMRGYLRGAEIAGVMSEFLRAKGHSARPHTQADSDVLHIPLVLWAGLGELSRIGELVLNPYVGPRFKSVVLTTDIPLEIDKPIDFGLQYFCQNCLKCARECPVSAIPFKEKVMFNGYEIWKPDVERCTRYRVTNQKGSACGRCMKTCPLNKVVTADGSILHRVGTWLGVHARWLKPIMVPIAVFFDDWLGYGKRNLVKKWWLDLEVVDGVCVIPKATNERDIDVTRDTSGDKSPVGYYPANVMPPPNSTEPVLINHRDAIKRSAEVETVNAAFTRHNNKGAKPEHYIPTKNI